MSVSMMRLHAMILMGGAAILVAGCGDKRAISKENFAEVLKQDYAANEDCLFSKPVQYPYEIAASDALLAKTRHQMDALAAAGLLTDEISNRGRDTIHRYELTASGKQVAGGGRFCYGRREVTSVDKFTPPTQFHGNSFTRVDYHFVEKDSAAWAKVHEVQSAFPVVAKTLAQQPVDEATLVLTGDGWVLNED
jgi:hypothetical protein